MPPDVRWRLCPIEMMTPTQPGYAPKSGRSPKEAQGHLSEGHRPSAHQAA